MTTLDVDKRNKPVARCSVIGALSLILMGGDAALAQNIVVDSLSPGATVRVWTTADSLLKQTGQFASWRGDSLQLRFPENRLRRSAVIPAHELKRVEARRRTGRQWLLGTLVGGGVGLASGLLIGERLCSDPDSGPCETKEQVFFGLLVAGMGSALGAPVGWAIPDRDWVEVSLEPGGTSAYPEGRRWRAVLLRLRIALPH